MAFRDGMTDLMPGAVDLRDVTDTTALSPLDTLALRRNLDAERRDGFQPPDKFVTVALYARFSTNKQKEMSIERQVKIVTAYMRKIGYTIYVLYADPARSARSMLNRESLQRLLKDCRSGRIKVIMVEDFDRWSRETYDAVEVCEELNELGVQFHSAGDAKALNKKEVIEAALKAEADRDRRTLIMGMGRFQHASQGGAHSGEFFGYRYGEQPGYLVPDPDEANTVVTVFEMAAAGISLREIGKHMKARGVAGPTKDCKWTKSTVSNILTRLSYTGRWYYPWTLNRFDRKENKTKATPRHPSEMTREHFEDLRIVSDELYYSVNSRRRTLGKRKEQQSHFLCGKATCDCPRAEGQLFTFGTKQLHCRVWSDGDHCPARRHSVMLATVERAVLGAVCEKLRSFIGEEDFAAAVDRSLREAAARRRVVRGEVEQKIADKYAQLRRMLKDEIRSAYPTDLLSEERDLLQREFADLQNELASLTELPEANGVDEKLRTLSATLDHLVERVPFRARTAAEAKVSTALARLIQRVVVMREGRPTGTMRLAIHLDFLAFLHEDGVPRSGGDGMHLVHVDVEQPMGRHARLRIDAERLHSTGKHRIDDERWALVADHLPDVTSHRKDSRDISTRALVDSLLLRLRTGLPLLSAAFGDTVAEQRALSRFVYAAGDQILLDVLRDADPDFVASLDMRPVEAARVRWKIGDKDRQRRRVAAGRLRALESKDALTDEHWAASEPLLHPCVELSYKGNPGLPGRLLLEAVILALRTGLAWRRMPDRFGGDPLLINSVRRLVRSGSWDRLLELWSLRFPELLDGLDVGRLAKMLRGSDQWRGPSPKRSRYAAGGAVVPAARPARHRNTSTAATGRRPGAPSLGWIRQQGFPGNPEIDVLSGLGEQTTTQDCPDRPYLRGEGPRS
ncbi:DNA invertase Pin-like site-specific DNA recombinase/transposase [Methylobacterium sp. RAS18]|nr:DNA invertase Pin-like site-specific DNA recombinase/transposase [Methylobacterium sp. RAS18]